MKQEKKTIVLQLNELNFQEILVFSHKYNLKNLVQYFKDYKTCKTEDEYELLEPWIQWTSFLTGKQFKDHKIFKIGDTEKSNLNFFPNLISFRYKVGSFFSMNLPSLSKGSVFFPDPWIKNKNQNLSKLEKIVHDQLSFFVNNNSAKKVGIKNYLYLAFIMIYFFRLNKLHILVRLVLKSLTQKYYRAILFDLICLQIYEKYQIKNNFDLSLLFLNGGAHIQHHHLLSFDKNKQSSNYPNDPFSNYLYYLDYFLGIFLKKFSQYNVLIITGLSQKIIKNPILYYRLNDHKQFLDLLELEYLEVQPLMSRDFFIHFSNIKSLNYAYEKLKKLKVSDGNLLFGDFQIYENNKLFLASIYNKQISNQYIEINSKKIPLKNFLNFVAKKNSIHNDKCFYKLISNQSNLNLKNIKNIKDFNKIFLKFYD